MRKQVLVSVDRGETRVAILEGQGGRRRSEGAERAAVEGRSRRSTRTGGSPSSTSSAAAGARSSATSTRAGSTTCSPGWRPRSSTSASRRTASSTSTRSSPPDGKTAAPRPRRGGGGPRISDLLKRAGDRRAGHQGPDRHEGRAAHDGDLDPGPLPGVRARRRRASASRAGCPTRSASGCASSPRA